MRLHVNVPSVKNGLAHVFLTEHDCGYGTLAYLDFIGNI